MSLTQKAALHLWRFHKARLQNPRLIKKQDARCFAFSLIICDMIAHYADRDPVTTVVSHTQLLNYLPEVSEIFADREIKTGLESFNRRMQELWPHRESLQASIFPRTSVTKPSQTPRFSFNPSALGG